MNAFALVPALIAVQIAAFGWRINREITVQDDKRRSWLPLPDLFNLASLLGVAGLCVVIPLATGTFTAVSWTAVAVGYVLIALHPVNMAAHYRLFSREGRAWYLSHRKDYPYATRQEIVTIAATIIAAVVIGRWVWFSNVPSTLLQLQLPQAAAGQPVGPAASATTATDVNSAPGFQLLLLLAPKFLEAPFLIVSAVLLFVLAFRRELGSLLSRGDILLSWGERSIRLRELSKSLDEELDPIRDDIKGIQDALQDKGIALDSSVAGVAATSVNDRSAAAKRVREELESSEFRWRSVERLAAASGLSQSQVLEMLRADPAVRLSLGKSGRQIAGLRSRVG